MAGASASMTVEADLSSTARRPSRARVHRKASLVRDAEHYFRLPSYFKRKASLTFADVKRKGLELFSTPPPCLTPTLREDPVSYRHIIACPNYQRHRGNADAMRSRSLQIQRRGKVQPSCKKGTRRFSALHRCLQRGDANRCLQQRARGETRRTHSHAASSSSRRANMVGIL